MRSYRLHFKKWGITRASQLKELRAQRANAGEQNITVPYDSTGHENLLDGSGSERAHSLPPESDSQRQLRGLQASPASNTLRSGTLSRQGNQLESVYRRLRTANRNERDEILDEASFAKNSNSILHFAATREDPWTLHNIVDYLMSRDPPISVDIPDIARRTPLEIAIQSDKVVAVGALLRAGASVVRRNENQQQPIHFAIAQLALPEIIRLLLDFEADADSPFPQPGGTVVTPLYMTLERLSAARDEREKDILCLVLQHLIDHGAHMNFVDEEESPLMKFIRASTELNSTHGLSIQTQSKPSSLLGFYFQADRNPLCWFPSEFCPAHRCESMAAFIFAHTPNSGLPQLLIESTDLERYGTDLMDVLLSPCKMRHSSQDDPSINNLLLMVLQNMNIQGVQRPLQSTLLRKVVRKTLDQKNLEFLEPLLKQDWVSETESRSLLELLNRLDKDRFRLSVAECLLSQLNLDHGHIFNAVTTVLFHQTPAGFHDITHDDSACEKFQGEVLEHLQVSPPMAEERTCIVRCVVHVFTKLMLEEKFGRFGGMSSERTIYIAIRLRERYDLPDVPVARNLLLGLKYVKSRQNKHLARAQQEGDSPMSDAYLTPESTR